MSLGLTRPDGEPTALRMFWIMCATVSSLTRRKDCTLFELRRWRVVVFRTCLQNSPYGANAMSLVPYIISWGTFSAGRLAQILSWVLRISWAYLGDETMRVGTWPSFRCMRGPYFLERSWRDW
ncbi:hypothetical protein QJS10_CPB04g01583 [Acorus calamus]|uniref:Uncharacterized protein n=1 Tax=Acorus calamus TaxID=4465 RepID=A0AAV9EWP7_ACOCL|nr:hypothetical protein QJS10_CPB04g01583 [Acorus calamus]